MGTQPGRTPLRYVAPSGQRASEYEELTLHSQWSPYNFAKQGWFNWGSGDRPSWDDRSTRLRCVAVPKPESWWYDGKRAQQPAVPLERDHQVEQVGKHSQSGWWGYRDPSQMWFRPYVEMQAGQENMVELATAGAARLELYRAVSPAWLRFVERYYAAWRYVEYGLFMALCYAQREALSDVVATPFLFQAIDKERHAQDIALHCMALEQMVEGFSDAAAIDTWMNDPLLQPVRRYVEFLLAARDWAEILFAINFAFEPLVGRLMTNFMVAQQGSACGDPVTPLIAETAEADRERAAAAAVELSRYVIANVPANRGVIEEWMAHWTPLALEAAENLHQLALHPNANRDGFGLRLEQLKAEQRALLVRAGLTTSGGANVSGPGRVAFKLTAGLEAEAVATVLAARYPAARVERFPAYISVECADRMCVDIPRVGEVLGGDYDVTRFLVIMSSYLGSITVNDESVELISDEGRAERGEKSA